MSSNNGTVRIRPMSAADVGRVMEIAASLKEAPQWPVSSYVTAMKPEHSPLRIALIAADCESDTLKGFLVASLVPPEAELETIAVAAHAQRQGIGLGLLHALIHELRRHQVSELVLEVRASNVGALGFYRAQGFEECGRRLRYYAEPEEDAILMRKNLS